MKQKVNMKRLSIFLVLICIIIAIVILLIVSNNKEKYIFGIENKENITKIVSQKNNTENKIEISNDDMVKKIVDYITQEEMVTKKESISDTPNVDEYYIITFKGIDEVIYIYSKNNNYYVEKPYNGIYNITEEKYNNLSKYLYLN